MFVPRETVCRCPATTGTYRYRKHASLSAGRATPSRLTYTDKHGGPTTRSAFNRLYCRRYPIIGNVTASNIIHAAQVRVRRRRDHHFLRRSVSFTPVLPCRSPPASFFGRYAFSLKSIRTCFYYYTCVCVCVCFVVVARNGLAK